MILIDGVGIGRNDPKVNPCARGSWQIFNNFIDRERREPIPQDGTVVGIDARLGVPGLPQSATGQTTILTGVNAPQHLGHHLNGYPVGQLKKLLLEKSLLKQLKALGKRVAFINAYSPIFLRLRPPRLQRYLSATTWATLAAEVPFFQIEDVIAGRSLFHDFTNQALQRAGLDVPLFTAWQAGEILARASAKYDFSLFEYFETDKAGHAQDMSWAEREVARLEEFLQGVLSTVELEQTLLLVVSDHGNLEDLSVKTHTLNPALAVVWGPGKETFGAQLRSLVEVAPLVVNVLTNAPGEAQHSPFGR